MIEVIVAVLLLGSIAVLMGSLYSTASIAQKAASGDTLAITLVKSKLEQVKSLDHDELSEHDSLYMRGVVDHSPPESPYSFTSVDGISGKLLDGTGTLRIEEHTDDSDLYRVKVRVEWTDSKGKRRSIDAATEVSNAD